MEINRRRRNEDMFSFPITTVEFGCVESPNSPADHLFFNGKLLPHAFPIQTPSRSSFSCSRSTSRTSSSSSSSKSSLMSSRSNSCSARSSTSTDSESKLMSSTSSPVKRKKPPVLNCQYQYGSTQRWQLFAAAPVPVGSRFRKVIETKKKSDPVAGRARSWFGSRIFKSFMLACIECHAIQEL